MTKAFLIVYCLLFLIGCVYEAPLTEKHEIKIDPDALGIWESKSEKDEKMMILKFSDTEYLLHYPINKDDFYFRAYPIKIGDQLYIQLKMIGNHEGSITKDEKNLYTLAIYQLKNDELELRTIKAKFMNNNHQTNGEFKSTKDLEKAIAASKDIKELFEEPLLFRKIVKK